MIAPRRHSRFRLAFFRAAERLAARLGGRGFYRWRYLSPRRLAVRHETVRFAHPGALRIVQLSDLHVGPFVGAGDLAAVLARVRELRPDIVVVTGDFVANHVDELWPSLDELRSLDAPLGVYAVFGNHDYKDRREKEIVAALPAWRFLRNASARVETPSGLVVGLAGIEDLEEGRPADVEAALARFPHGADVRVALSHGPLGALAFARAGFDVVLTGHSHGTQIDLPFLRDLGPAHPGLRIELGGTSVIVSRGLGPIGVPLRVGAPAELVVVDLAGDLELA